MDKIGCDCDGPECTECFMTEQTWEEDENEDEIIEEDYINPSEDDEP